MRCSRNQANGCNETGENEDEFENEVLCVRQKNITWHGYASDVRPALFRV